MTTHLKEYLAANGITGNLENENQIRFFVDGWCFIFPTNEDDNYFRLVLPNVYKITEDYDKISRLINDINIQYKGVKATIHSDNTVWFSVEQFVYCFDNIHGLFERCIIALKSALNELRKQTI